MADVASDLKSWSTTAGSNSPAGGTSIGTGLDDNLREIQKVVRQDLATKGADIAAASTTDLGAVAGLQHDITVTGNPTITSFGIVSAGIWKIIKFEGALTLTHNATSLILPGGANITTADGDVAIMVSEGSGNWRCAMYSPATSYLKLSGGTLTGTLTGTTVAATTVTATTITGSSTVTGGSLITAGSLSAGSITGGMVATQAQQESAGASTVVVTPGTQHYHPSAPKAWGMFDGSAGSMSQAYNSTLTKNGTGDYGITITSAMSSSTYAVIATASAEVTRIHCSNVSSSVFGITTFNGGTATDAAQISYIVLGDK